MMFSTATLTATETQSLAPTKPLRLKVAAYNIHGGVGSDRRLDLARIVRVLQVAAPDVIAMNEVYRNPGGTPQDQALANALGNDWQAFFGKTIDKPNAEYGNAILTRLPVESSQAWLLDEWPKQEQRGLLRVTVRQDEKRIHIFCAHMGLVSTMREKNARQLVQILDQFDNGQHILLGDFNEVPPAPGLDYIAKSGYVDAWETYGLGPGHTFPARPPLRRLDYIWLSQGLAAETVYVGAFPEARIASDHRPVFATVVPARRNNYLSNRPHANGDIIRMENLARIPATEKPSWWSPLANVRSRRDAASQAAVEVTGNEHYWRQHSEGKLVYGEAPTSIKSTAAETQSALKSAQQGLQVSARILTVSPGAGWSINYGDLSFRLRHDHGKFPSLELLHNTNAVAATGTVPLRLDPYVWNHYTLLVTPTENNHGQLQLLVNGTPALGHTVPISDLNLDSGFSITTDGGGRRCEILLDDVIIRRFDPHQISIIKEELIHCPPKIIRAAGTRQHTSWWQRLWQ